MKGSLLSFLWVFVALSSFLISCSEQEIACNVSLTATKGGSVSI